MTSFAYIQIGAGAGDQDSRAGYKDEFTENIKKLKLSREDRVILVEPNPLNIPALTKCWSNIPQAQIHQLGIVPKAKSLQSLALYYTELDAPHFQVASFNPQHVLKHYTELTLPELQKIEVKTIDLETFLNQVTQDLKIELLSLDIEGLDAEVILDTNFSALNVNFVTFETLHLGKHAKTVHAHFKNAGFKPVKKNTSIKISSYDCLYQKVPQDIHNQSNWNIKQSILTGLSRILKKQFF
jgi:FkbM family methyltransferase